MTVHFPDQREALGRKTLEVLQDGVRRFGHGLGGSGGPIEVHVCDTISDFNALAGSLGTRRVAGFARSRQGLIVVKAPNLLGPDSSYPAIVRHELLHVLLARYTNPDHLPRWLNEGIAMELSREIRWSSLYRLARMYAWGRILDYDELPLAFAAPGNEVLFGDAYAQSLSMTRRLMTLAGQEPFWAIVRDLRTRPFPEALRRYTGLTPREFFDEWEGALWQFALLSSVVSGFSLFQFGAFLVIVAYVRKRRAAKRLMARWDEADDDTIFPWQLEDQDEPYPWEED